MTSNLSQGSAPGTGLALAQHALLLRQLELQGALRRQLLLRGPLLGRLVVQPVRPAALLARAACHVAGIANAPVKKRVPRVFVFCEA